MPTQRQDSCRSLTQLISGARRQRLVTKPFSLAFRSKMVAHLTGKDAVSTRQLALENAEARRIAGARPSDLVVAEASAHTRARRSDTIVGSSRRPVMPRWVSRSSVSRKLKQKRW